jgi:streptogramin lyase
LIPAIAHLAPRLLMSVTAVTVALLVSVGSAAALTPTITEFSAGINPGSYPDHGIAPGSDGNVWFVEPSPSVVGRITPTGAITEFSAGLNPGSHPEGLAAGPDGNLWFADPGSTRAIGRITPAGAITEFSAGLNAGSAPYQITSGPDGNLWFTDVGTTIAIGRITPAGAITEFSAGLTPASGPTAITAGADGNLWFGEGIGAIGRITPAGAITEFSAGLDPTDNPYGIAPGADGNVWFSDSSCPGAEIGRVTPAGVITKFSSGLFPGSCPYFIAAGPDGALWFTDEASPPTDAIGRITTAGEISEYSAGLNPTSTLNGISPGPDGNVWFTDNGTPPAIGRITTPPTAETGAASVLGAGAATVSGTLNGHSQPTVARFQYRRTRGADAAGPQIDAGSGSVNVAASSRLSGLRPRTTYRYRLEATNPTGTTPGAEGAFTTLALPVVRGLKVKPRIWRRGRKPAKASKRGRRARVGTRIIFRLNRAAPVRLKFLLKRRGRRGKSRFHFAGSMALKGHRGRNTVRFQGRISKKWLKPGNYRLKVTARDSTAPKHSSTRVARFKLVGRR